MAFPDASRYATVATSSAAMPASWRSEHLVDDVAAGQAGAWKSHTVKAARVSVSAPDTWIDVTRLSPQVLAKVNEIPSLRQYVELAQKSKAIKLILVDAGSTSVKNRYATNM